MNLVICASAELEQLENSAELVKWIPGLAK